MLARQGAGNLLHALSQACPLPIFVLDPRGVVLWLNQAAESTFGWPAETLVGKPYPLVPASDRDEFARLLEPARYGEALAKAGLSRLSVPFIDKPFTWQTLTEKVPEVLAAPGAP